MSVAASLTRIVREPLVLFLGVGALVFAFDPSSAVDAESPTTIVLDASRRADLGRQLEEALGRAPTDDERARAEEQWVRTEILVREAQALGLDDDDPVVRDRLAKKMSFVARSVTAVPTPPEAELRAMWEEGGDEFRVDAAITLRQVWAPDEATAVRLVDAWRGGADPRELGDPAPGGPVLRGRSPEALAERYGEAFAQAVSALPEGEIALVGSSVGWHGVRVEKRRDARALDFEGARDRLALRWQATWAEAAAEEAIEALRERYTVVVAP